VHRLTLGLLTRAHVYVQMESALAHMPRNRWRRLEKAQSNTKNSHAIA